MSDPGSSGQGYPGWRGVSTGNTEFNRVWFLIQQALRLMRTATLVQVQACSNSGGLTAVGTVDVLPLVQMTNGLWQAQSHVTVYGLPYFRLTGGSSAVIMDPAVNDIGLAVMGDRDLSAVKASLAQAPPGSRRKFSLSDGLFFGVFLSASAPAQYIHFNANGITITDLNGNTTVMSNIGVSTTDKNGNTMVMNSSGITINGVLFDRSQHITNIADATSQSGVDLTGHVHPITGIQTGTSNIDTGTPTG